MLESSRDAVLTILQERLQPAGAVAKLNERVKRIGKVNSEIADWLSVRIFSYHVPAQTSKRHSLTSPAGTPEG